MMRLFELRVERIENGYLVKCGGKPSSSDPLGERERTWFAADGEVGDRLKEAGESLLSLEPAR